MADDRLVLDASKVLDGTVWFPYPTGPVKLLGPATDAVAATPAGSGPAVALDLLLACLHHHVGTEIGIGPVRVSVADDAIALGTIEP